MPSLASIVPVEQACGSPVLSAATAAVHAMLRVTETSTSGELLTALRHGEPLSS
jgi:maleate cis-trans isomerase